MKYVCSKGEGGCIVFMTSFYCLKPYKGRGVSENHQIWAYIPYGWPLTEKLEQQKCPGMANYWAQYNYCRSQLICENADVRETLGAGHVIGIHFESFLGKVKLFQVSSF